LYKKIAALEKRAEKLIAAEEAAKKLKKLKKASKIAEYTKFGKNVGKAYKGAKSGKLREALLGVKKGTYDYWKKSTNLFQQAHHIIPVELLKKNPIVQKAVDEGFKFNGKVNGIMLDYTKHSGSHGKYTEIMNQTINALAKNNPTKSATEILNMAVKEGAEIIKNTAGKLK
jgi:hypothetical protein